MQQCELIFSNQILAQRCTPLYSWEYRTEGALNLIFTCLSHVEQFQNQTAYFGLYSNKWYNQKVTISEGKLKTWTKKIVRCKKSDIVSMIVTNCKENKCETAALQETC